MKLIRLPENEAHLSESTFTLLGNWCFFRLTLHRATSKLSEGKLGLSISLDPDCAKYHNPAFRPDVITS